MASNLDAAVRLMREPGEGSVEMALRALEPTVFSFSMKLCRHREDAEDTMQEVLASSLRHFSRLEDPRALSVWLYTVARNRCIKVRKRALARRTLPLEELASGEERSRWEPASIGTDPEQAALQTETQRVVREAVLRLPPTYGRILTLHDLDELDTVQIARMLSLHPGTVRVQLHRARALLRRELATSVRPFRKSFYA